MENYDSYKLTDFLTDERFIGWVLAPDGASEKHWQEVFAAYPEILPAAEAAQEVLLNIRIKPQQQMPDNMRAELMAGVRSHVGQSASANRGSMQRLIRVGRWVAAACVLVALGFAVYRLGNLPAASDTDLVIVKEHDGQGIQRVSNTSDIPLIVLLPDKSTVILDPDASLTYAERDFTRQRQVHLTGDAFFEVQRQAPDAPFMVNTDHFTAKVLGTSFRVVASGEQPVYRVTVRTGLVEVKRKETVVQVAANEEAIFEVASAALTRARVPEAVPPSHKVVEEEFDFQGTPLDSVIASLADRYNVSIRISDPHLAKRTITASLGGLHLYEKLELISRAAEASYTLNDGKIIVSPIQME